MTDATPPASVQGGAGSNAGLFRGVLKITERDGSERLVEFEAPAGAASISVNGQNVPVSQLQS